MNSIGSSAAPMSRYDHDRWNELQAHWTKKANRRALVPAKAREAIEATGQATRGALTKAGTAVGDAAPKGMKNFSGVVVDSAIVPTVEAVVNLLELINDWVVELNDPDAVLAHHREKGRSVEKLEDLQQLELKDLEAFTRGMVLRWRTFGAGAGASFGALAMIPVPVLGSAAAITVDMVAMQALTGAIVTRICYAYGYDPNDPDMRLVIERMIRRAYKRQAPKATTVRSAGRAFSAAKDRVNWSQKLRDDHRIMEAVEKLLKQVGDGKRVPVKNARMGMPVLAVFMGAATNAHVLGDVAKQARHYAATLHLAEKHGLELPASLLLDSVDDLPEEEAD